MLLSLTWQQLAALVALVSFFSLLSYSRHKPFVLQPILTIGAIILVLSTSIWNFTLMSTAWFGGEKVFEHPNFGSLPKALQYGCSSVAAVILFSGLVGVVWCREYSLRQRFSYLLASLFLAFPLGFIALAPSRLQSMVDGIAVP